jgi:hypothetical protein
LIQAERVGGIALGILYIQVDEAVSKSLRELGQILGIDGFPI